MKKVDMQTSCKNGISFDLVNAESFNQALTKYIENPPQDVEDSNFFMIYLKPSNLYLKEDQQNTCMYFDEFMFTPQTPVAVSQINL